jgi:P4 family phage/plasmid primase-like protien
VDAWRAMMSKSRILAVVALTRGIVEHWAEDFDSDPLALNTPGEIVDLRTGEVRPHDPAELHTKITKGKLAPGHQNPDWRKALEALPPAERDWWQIRVGQGITGFTTPDGVVPILQGTGENGKSLLTTDGLVVALGDYADVCSPKLITSERNEHSTEMADLRGKRLLISEEMTEKRALNITAIKRIQDVGKIRARFCFKDNMSFEPSHSLIATSNYTPVVTETDDGTWRRLALVVFPYTFCKPWQALEAPHHRRGDLDLKGRILAGKQGQHDAIVRWAVEGAVRYHREGKASLQPPAAVADATRAWRVEADRILGFWDEMLIPDPKACIECSDLLETFNLHLDANGHAKWATETFQPKFAGHSETRLHQVTKKQEQNPADLWAWNDGSPTQLNGKIRGKKRVRIWRGVRYRTTADEHLAASEQGKR